MIGIGLVPLQTVPGDYADSDQSIDHFDDFSSEALEVHASPLHNDEGSSRKDGRRNRQGFFIRSAQLDVTMTEGFRIVKVIVNFNSHAVFES